MLQIKGNKLRGHLDALVLAVLSEGNAHGLEIIKRLEGAGCGALRLKEGSLYPSLYRLEEAGFLKADWETETKGRRGARRRIYRITPKGRSALSKERKEWSQFVQVIGGIIGAST